MATAKKFEKDVVVIGGCGHVGLPLAIMFASKSLKVVAFDTNTQVVATVNSGSMPFDEPGADDVLKQVLATKSFTASSDRQFVSLAEHVVVVIGTPVDEHLNPIPISKDDVVKCLENIKSGNL